MRKRKGDINPNPGFKKELKEYEKVAAPPPPSLHPLFSRAFHTGGGGAGYPRRRRRGVRLTRHLRERVRKEGRRPRW